LGESLAILEQADPTHEMRRVLHVNLVEGCPVAGEEQVPMLVDENGMFCISFIKLWLWNLVKHGKSRKVLQKQLETEIAAQLDRVTRQYDYHITAIDSHQHYHMIPIVFDALMNVLENQDFQVKEIRIPVDPVMPMLKAKRPKRVPSVNWVKWFILHLHKSRNMRILKAHGIESPIFCGIFYTCEMTTETVRALLPTYRNYARKCHRSLELMFHPGNLLSRQELMDARREELAVFYLSDYHYAEAACLKDLKDSR